MDFQPATERSTLAVMHRASHDQQQMTLLLTSDTTELCLVRGSSVRFDQKKEIYFLPMQHGTSHNTMLEQLGIEDIRAFLNGIRILSSFVYVPAAQQLQRQIEKL